MANVPRTDIFTLHLLGENAKQFAHSKPLTRAHPLAKYLCVAESRHSSFLWCCSQRCGICTNVCRRTLQPNFFNRLRAFRTFCTLNARPPFFYNVRTLNVNHHLQQFIPISRHIMVLRHLLTTCQPRELSSCIKNVCC